MDANTTSAQKLHMNAKKWTQVTKPIWDSSEQCFL